MKSHNSTSCGTPAVHALSSGNRRFGANEGSSKSFRGLTFWGGIFFRVATCGSGNTIESLNDINNGGRGSQAMLLYIVFTRFFLCSLVPAQQAFSFHTGWHALLGPLGVRKTQTLHIVLHILYIRQFRCNQVLSHHIWVSVLHSLVRFRFFGSSLWSCPFQLKGRDVVQIYGNMATSLILF